ncbi:50S ribosomal protein L3 [Candidatus Woesearchaeota archaeon]|nr:50S ribosomal protein L3 [Candidatus Woesearchaeota archaeon]
MPTTRVPRRGSLQFWPRKRAKRIYPRVRCWADIKEVRPLGFAGYKVGMTHIIVADNRKNSLTKGEDISYPITIIECPPIKAASIRFYKNKTDGLKLVSEVFAADLDKELERKIILPKKVNKKIDDIKDYNDIRLLVYTQPKLTGIGKKKPEIFEVAIGGTKEEKLKFAQEKLGKEITIKDVFKEGQQLDIHSVTKGKGFQGPMRRFGIGLRSHKSEKAKRNPGSLGAWCGQGHMMWRVAHAGKMGYHTRTEYNKWLIKIGDKIEEINQRGGFLNYGNIKNTYILVKGSTGGPIKRIVRLNYPIKENQRIPKEAPIIQYISLRK